MIKKAFYLQPGTAGVPPAFIAFVTLMIGVVLLLLMSCLMVFAAEPGTVDSKLETKVGGSSTDNPANSSANSVPDGKRSEPDSSSESSSGSLSEKGTSSGNSDVSTNGNSNGNTQAAGASGPAAGASGPSGPSGPFTGAINLFAPIDGSTNNVDPLSGSSNTTDPLTGSTGTTDPLSGSSNASNPLTGSATEMSPLTGSVNESTSTLPPFRLGTVHKEIWAPIRSDSIMNGVYDKKQSALQGQTTVNFLQGRVTRDGAGSPLSTVQRVVHPRILTGYTMLRPQGPEQPSLFKELQAQLDKSRPNLEAAIQKAKREMDAQLAHPDLRKFPKLDPVIAKNQNLPDLRTEIPRVSPLPVPQVPKSDPNPMLQAEIDRAKREMDWQIAMANRGTGIGVPYVQRLNSDVTVDLSQIKIAKQNVQADLEFAKKQMQAELARAKSATTPDLSAERTQVELAKKQTQAEIAKAKPALDALMTKIRMAPQLNMPSVDSQLSTNDVDAELSGEKVIQWDLWYRKIASLYEPKLLKAISKHGNPEGANTVSITVTASHRLQAAISEPDNPEFDAATLEAYKSLDGNPALQFPAGSHRQQVSFLIDNKHNNPSPVSKVSSQTYTGDKEVQGFKWKH